MTANLSIFPLNSNIFVQFNVGKYNILNVNLLFSGCSVAVFLSCPNLSKIHINYLSNLKSFV